MPQHSAPVRITLGTEQLIDPSVAGPGEYPGRHLQMGQLFVEGPGGDQGVEMPLANKPIGVGKGMPIGLCEGGVGQPFLDRAHVPYRLTAVKMEIIEVHIDVFQALHERKNVDKQALHGFPGGYSGKFKQDLV